MKFNILELESVDSTNSWILRQKDYPSGTVVVAKCQHAGRGRLQRSWLMSDGDLAMSVLLLKPHWPEPLSLLSLIPALAVIKVLAKYKISAYIKWPNDIVVKNNKNLSYEYFGEYQKLGGILVENVWAENSVPASVIGVGLNIVRNTNKQVPHMLSLAELGLTINARDILLELLKTLSQLLTKPDPELLLADYQKNCVSLGRLLSLEINGQMLVGVGCGLNSDGSLFVKSGNIIHRICAGDVNFCV